MKQHYIVQAVMAHWSQEFLCPMGAFCVKEELGAILKGKGVARYKIKSVDGDPVAHWEESEWVPV